jgi:hypothetical protein
VYQHPNVVVVGPKGYAGVREALEGTGLNSTLSYYRRWWTGVRFYHRDGNAYEVENGSPERPLGVLARLLALTIYNPKVKVKYRYRPSGPYSLDELRAAVGKAIAEDDDILIQFRERHELMSLLGQAQSFDDVVSVLLLCQRDARAG